jgi:hypothetical protein
LPTAHKTANAFSFFDQFEVVLIRHQEQPSETSGLQALFTDIRQRGQSAYPGLIVLLAFRSDYKGLLKNMALPRWAEDENEKQSAHSRALLRRHLSPHPEAA